METTFILSAVCLVAIGCIILLCIMRQKNPTREGMSATCYPTIAQCESVCTACACDINCPNGICTTSGYTCVNGTCQPCDCSSSCPGGTCPNGESCQNGTCQSCTCSSSCLTGSCPSDDLTCQNGQCILPVNIEGNDANGNFTTYATTAAVTIVGPTTAMTLNSSANTGNIIHTFYLGLPIDFLPALGTVVNSSLSDCASNACTVASIPSEGWGIVIPSSQGGNMSLGNITFSWLT